MLVDFTRFRVVSHTGDDDKDRDNGMIGVLLSGSDVVFAFGPIGGGLIYRNGTDNDWSIHDQGTGLVRSLSSDEISKSKLVMSMNGDDGDWISAFSLFGYTAEGHSAQLLSRTRYVKFRSGKNDHFEFPLDAVSLRASQETIEAIAGFFEANRPQSQ